MAIEDHQIERHPEKRINSDLPQETPYLLPEIIAEILSRLPVKSLLQFRSVSKSWRSLISDPKFVKTHLNICSNNDDYAHHRLIFISGLYGEVTIKICHLSPVLNLVSVNPSELDYPMTQAYMFLSVSIVGSVNGLIAIAIDNHDTFLWNPTIRIWKKLPQSGFKFHRPKYLIIVYGFGYDESHDDYKLVGVFGPTNVESFEVMVYSLRADCWRRIGDFPSGWAPVGGKGKFLKGKIHWFAYITRSGSSLSPCSSRSIVSLDLANETYSEVPQPIYREGEFALSLDVLGECLFLLADCHQNHMNVWMMKEYGVRESWTKLASFPYLDGPRKYEYPVLLFMSKKGEILLAFGLCILLFDLKSYSFRSPDISNFDARLGSYTYIESLVSPLILEGQERHQ